MGRRGDASESSIKRTRPLFPGPAPRRLYRTDALGPDDQAARESCDVRGAAIPASRRARWVSGSGRAR